jgi:hypothetical protein
MLGNLTRRWATLLIVSSLLGPATAGADSDPCAEAITRALKLLPRQPERVVVVDTENATPLLQAKLQHVDGFVTTGLRIVYLKRQGAALQQAVKKPGFFDHVLAIVIWHEMAHLEGADEATAQRAEEDLWTQYVVTRRVDGPSGLRYLALLKKRHSPS